jgi:hypothetical protein
MFYVPKGGTWLCMVAMALLTGAIANAQSLYPDGPELMARLRSALPDIPLRLESDLQARNHRGEIVRVVKATMDVDWGAAEPMAQYVIRDRFGSEKESLTITWPYGAPPRYRYTQGDPPEETSLADLNQVIDELDVSWAELSLSFLWWPGGEIIDTDRVRGRFCHVVELSAPEDAVTSYARVRLWIDPETYLLMRADAFDDQDTLVRRLEVKSLRKIDEIWMVQNLDIFAFPSRSRVTLRVRSLETLDGRLMWVE